MFGLEILDVVIGLIFVYLLLSLFASALNEYIAAVLNLRGKELAKGLGRLLDDVDETNALDRAADGLRSRAMSSRAALTQQFYSHPLIRPLASREGKLMRLYRWLDDAKVGRGGIRSAASEKPRLPSYIPARSFALALLDVLGIEEKDASLERLIPAGVPAVQTPDEARTAVEAAEAALRAAETAATSATDAGKKAIADAGLKLSNARLAKAVADAKAALTAAENPAPPPGANDSQAAPGATNAQTAKAVAVARGNFIKAQLAQATALAEQGLAAAQGADAVAEAQLNLAKVKLAKVLAILKQDSPLELTEHLETLTGLPQADKLASALQVQVAGLVAGAQTQLQKLHDGVEVWFNNAMDRVSGAYKRTAQGWLFLLGLLIASCMNADTIDMWRRLAENDELRAAMVKRAEAAVTPMDSLVADSAAAADRDTVSRPQPPTNTPATQGSARNPAIPPVQAPAQDTATPPVQTPGQASPRATDTLALRLQSQVTNTVTPGDTTQVDSTKLAAVKRARENYERTRARLDSMELKLGWTLDEAVRVGLLRKDSTETDTLKPARARTQPVRAPAAPPDSAQAQQQGWVPRGYDVDLLFPFKSRAGFLKLIGLLMTGIAISLGAPFWFDLLNKVISIRAAGRAPNEQPKSPEGGPKRAAETTPK